MKRFKEWEKEFTTIEIAACRQEWLYNGTTKPDVRAYVLWPLEVERWSQDVIQDCVYNAKDAREWQLFRVSMKGLTTHEKLYMLHNRYVSRDAHIFWVEKCRIDNYIGALVRGGQLNSQLEVVK